MSGFEEGCWTALQSHSFDSESLGAYFPAGVRHAVDDAFWYCKFEERVTRRLKVCKATH